MVLESFAVMVLGMLFADMFDRCVTTVADALAKAKKIGFPVMIKASEGGGGKGIRMCKTEETFPASFRQVLAEVCILCRNCSSYCLMIRPRSLDHLCLS